MSLTEPHLKMSKSHANPKSRILITDGREEIEKKIKSALTDSINGVSYDPLNRPGVSNLLEILYHVQENNQQASLQELVKDCEGLSLRALKGEVVESIDRHLAGIREEYISLTIGPKKNMLHDASMLGASKANENAKQTMETVRNAIGL